MSANLGTCDHCGQPFKVGDALYKSVRRPHQPLDTFVPKTYHQWCDSEIAASGKGRRARIAREDARVSSKDVKPKKTIVRRNP